jgi:hypothetical protein
VQLTGPEKIIVLEPSAGASCFEAVVLALLSLNTATLAIRQVWFCESFQLLQQRHGFGLHLSPKNEYFGPSLRGCRGRESLIRKRRDLDFAKYQETLGRLDQA